MLSIVETASSRSHQSQRQYRPNHRDRKDLEILINQLADKQGLLNGPNPTEISILRYLFEQCAEENDHNDAALAHMLQMTRQAIIFTEATNKTDPQRFYANVGKALMRVGITQREMNRSPGVENNHPEPGEWFFDQEWSFWYNKANRGFGFSTQTLVHHAEGRGPIVYRTGDFWIDTELPESICEGIIGEKLGKIIDKEGLHTKIAGESLNEWIIADSQKDGNKLNMKFKLP